MIDFALVGAGEEGWHRLFWCTGEKMRGQIFVDLIGAFLVLMLIAASGFATIEKMGSGRAGASAVCAEKNILHSYADWIVKEGGALSKSNADGSGYYLDHDVNLEKIGGVGGNFDIFVSYADGREEVVRRGANGRESGDYFCVKRVALCENEICAIRVCSNENV